MVRFFYLSMAVRTTVLVILRPPNQEHQVTDNPFQLVDAISKALHLPA
jgi:hypothetical protein